MPEPAPSKLRSLLVTAIGQRWRWETKRMSLVLLSALMLSYEASASSIRELVQKAENGDLQAQTTLGYVYVTGKGMPKDPHEALRWFSIAAEQGDLIAQENLGLMLLRGTDIAKDTDAAYRWLRLAGSSGSAKAQGLLGLMHLNGDGVERDPVEARFWLTCASKQNDSIAQLYLGKIYFLGDGVIKDLHLAYVWTSIAALNGSRKALAQQEEFESFLSEEQLSHANTESKNLLKKIRFKRSSLECS